MRLRSALLTTADESYSNAAFSGWHSAALTVDLDDEEEEQGEEGLFSVKRITQMAQGIASRLGRWI